MSTGQEVVRLETITGKVINFTSIPTELTEEHWLSDYYPDSYVQVHIDLENGEGDEVDDWIMKNHPELEKEDYFFIKIDF